MGNSTCHITEDIFGYHAGAGELIFDYKGNPDCLRIKWNSTEDALVLMDTLMAAARAVGYFQRQIEWRKNDNGK